MTKTELSYIIEDIKHLTLFPQRYNAPKGRDEKYWRGVSRSYGNCQKALETSDYRWRMIEYRDGHKELAYLRVLHGGILSGMYPAIYRGLIIPRRIGIGTFANIKEITLAF